MQRLVWTLMRDGPFVLGGNHRMHPCGIEVDADGPHDLGAGFSGYVVTAPNGRTFIAEATTGAFVGPTLAAVRRDVASADKEVMEFQVAQAHKQTHQIERLPVETFWRRLNCLPELP